MPLVVLVAAMVMESLSFRTAIRETNHVRADASYVEFIRRAKQPELPVILLEDFAALIGLFFALLGVGLSLITQNLWFDVVGTALIGLLLVAVAVVLAIETKSLLLGESASVAAERRIVTALTATEGIDSIVHLKTMHLGPDELSSPPRSPYLPATPPQTSPPTSTPRRQPSGRPSPRRA